MRVGSSRGTRGRHPGTQPMALAGWLRDFLGSHAPHVIQSYGSSLSAYGLFFSGAHFVWGRLARHRARRGGGRAAGHR
ncbi:hypothetical protein KC221_28200, partial [Mycobacterium tuberculosis]|nr:hypothetical protein [Mycobacterium tuberculosis]